MLSQVLRNEVGFEYHSPLLDTRPHDAGTGTLLPVCVRSNFPVAEAFWKQPDRCGSDRRVQLAEEVCNADERIPERDAGNDETGFRCRLNLTSKRPAQAVFKRAGRGHRLILDPDLAPIHSMGHLSEGRARKLI